MTQMQFAGWSHPTENGFGHNFLKLRSHKTQVTCLTSSYKLHHSFLSPTCVLCHVTCDMIYNFLIIVSNS